MRHTINPNLLKAAQEFSGGLLKVPDTAKAGRGGNFHWSERLVVESSEVKDGDNGMTTLMVNFRVSPASQDITNVNRRTNARMNFNWTATEGSGQAVMTAISVARVKALLEALGNTIDSSEGFTLEDYFGPEATVYLKGMEVNARLTDKPDRDDPTVRRQEITGFTPVAD
jgi:hypothetical protein